MDELFSVDAEARRKALTTAARHIRRQETAKRLLDDIRSRIDAAQSIALPSSALSKACQYALTLWKKLTRFLEYPELELSTNLAENSMRPVALGRKNVSGKQGACGECALMPRKSLPPSPEAPSSSHTNLPVIRPALSPRLERSCRRFST
jgi:hypothetical protein